jgi:hypothetical protein
MTSYILLINLTKTCKKCGQPEKRSVANSRHLSELEFLSNVANFPFGRAWSMAIEVEWIRNVCEISRNCVSQNFVLIPKKSTP